MFPDVVSVREPLNASFGAYDSLHNLPTKLRSVGRFLCLAAHGSLGFCSAYWIHPSLRICARMDWPLPTSTVPQVQVVRQQRQMHSTLFESIILVRPCGWMARLWPGSR